MKLMRHLLGYAPVNLAQAIVGFGGVYVFTRLLGGEDYGRYALMFSLMTLTHTLSLTWAEAAAYRFAAEAEQKGERAVHIATMRGLWLRALGFSALLLGIAWFVLRNEPEYLHILPWIAVLLPILSTLQMALEIHKARQSVGRYVVVEVSRQLGGFALGALIAWQTGFGAASPFVGMAVAAGIAAASEGAWMMRQSRTARFDPARAKAALAYGAPIALALVLDILLSAGDRFLLAFFLDERAVGAYAAGYGVADKTILILCAWAALAGSPLVMAAWEAEGPDGARREARGMISTILLLGLPAATGLALVAHPLAEVMIAEDLRAQAEKTIPWIAFAGLLNGMLIYYWTEAFQLTRKTGQRAILMLVPTLANLGANLFMIPAFGLMGAVYATVGSYALGNLVLALAGRRHLALPLPLADIARLAVALAGMAGVLWLMPDWGGLLELFVKAGVGAIVYGTLAVALDAAGARAFLSRRMGRGAHSAGPTGAE